MTTVPFVCLHGSAKSLIALEHFLKKARDAIVSRLPRLLDECAKSS